jgi:hypothetical protein
LRTSLRRSGGFCVRLSNRCELKRTDRNLSLDRCFPQNLVSLFVLPQASEPGVAQMAVRRPLRISICATSSRFSQRLLWLMLIRCGASQGDWRKGSFEPLSLSRAETPAPGRRPDRSADVLSVGSQSMQAPREAKNRAPRLSTRARSETGIFGFQCSIHRSEIVRL